MTLDARALRVAQVVREVAVTYAVQAGGRDDLAGWCGTVSAALVELLGDRAHVVGGYARVRKYGSEGHYWVLYDLQRSAEHWEDRYALVDLTATQFPKLALPPVAVLLPGDARRLCYSVVDDDVDLGTIFGPRDWEDVRAIVQVSRDALEIEARASGSTCSAGASP